jgi:hypothetical protein
MSTKSITHNFKYTKEDIENLIKGDIARQLGMETIPIISHSINFRVDMEDDPNDWRAEFAQSPVFKGVDAKVEIPG